MYKKGINYKKQRAERGLSLLAEKIVLKNIVTAQPVRVLRHVITVRTV